ncbi:MULTISPECIES: lipoprotein LpqH [Mycobacterium]|uniref:Lipoprotein LppE n=1 Tax=Mycobacterium kiyosense TaxID=2871094 RepID=A0AA37PSJ5_9MYCO|nr:MULTISPECIES: lipoprotein LpqH [Mycobacterium]GLB81550.1 hypothetical protein SRL2020028_08060 [Mycobacterium kiyosense]GLD03783.1 hypothetical protein Mkiyose1383_01090 [Mycobacterium kiyosense]GLD10058.1 hypothetical protein Mkiyose1384_02780 [Mycobacterium kiyosense]GLD34504.1 hypothetical protein Mkiyose1595_07240 [Mycobacterium kiyosense]
MQNRLVTMAALAVAVAGAVSGCADSQTVPRKAAHVTIDGSTHAARPPACSQIQGYRTIDIRDRDGQIQAVVLMSGDRVMPQFVKIRNVDGFTGSYYEGGVGDAHVDLAKNTYTISGSASGINSANPDKVVTTDFKISAEC